MFGAEAADQFLAAYIARADAFEYDPYWDLESLLDTALPQPTFYPPWRDFGLAVLTPETLQRRMDAYLERIMEKERIFAGRFHVQDCF